MTPRLRSGHDIAGVSIAGVGSALPGRDLPGVHLDNARLAELSAAACDRLARAGGPHRPASTPDFPWQRIGIANRCVLDQSYSTRDLAVAAARNALRHSGVSRTDIAAVIVSTVTPDRIVPAIATSVQEELHLPRTTASFDLTLGCNGFVATLDVATCMLRARPRSSAALVIGAETMLRVLDASDRTTCTIFGDGAGAVVLRRSSLNRVQAIATYTLGEFGPRIEISAPEQDDTPVYRFVARNDQVSIARDRRSRQRVKMDGRRVFRDMVRMIPEVVHSYLDRQGLTVSDVDRFAFHQANAKMIDAITRVIGLRNDDSVLSNISQLGNTTSASIPLLLQDAAANKRLSPGDRVLLVGFGTGYSIGIALVEWSYVPTPTRCQEKQLEPHDLQPTQVSQQAHTHGSR